MSDDLPPHLDPFAIMAEYGFEAYVPAAREVLPEDWRLRYAHSPKTIAYGLTFYVAHRDHTQVDVAERYNKHHGSVQTAYKTLRDDLGDPTTDPEILKDVPLPVRPPHLDPLSLIKAHGFKAYVPAARKVLPEDWSYRYGHEPKTLAAALTHYVADDRLDVEEIASKYYVSTTAVNVACETLRADLDSVHEGPRNA